MWSPKGNHENRFQRYLRGKLYLKHAWAVIIHSALVSQKIATVLLGFWPRAASPLPR